MSVTSWDARQRRAAFDVIKKAGLNAKGTALAVELWNAEISVAHAVDVARTIYRPAPEARVGIALGVVAILGTVLSLLRAAKTEERK